MLYCRKPCFAPYNAVQQGVMRIINEMWHFENGSKSLHQLLLSGYEHRIGEGSLVIIVYDVLTS